MNSQKQLRRSIIVIIAAAMALRFAAVPSFAENSDITYHKNEKKAAAELRSYMVDRDTKVTVGFEGKTDEKGLKKKIGKLVNIATKHTGEPKEGDYIKFQYESYKGLGMTNLAGVTPVVEIAYNISYYDTAEQEKETDKKVSEIIDSLDLDEKTNYEKISAIYDYICDNVDYEQAKDDSNIRRTAYSALVEGKAVCQGYSASLYRLLLEAGIDNRIIFGEGVADDGSRSAHTWNIVELHGRYYYMDVTWGDTADRDEFFLRPAGSAFEQHHIADEEYTDEDFTEKYPMAEQEYKAEFNGFLEKAAGLVKWLSDSIHGARKDDKGQQN